MQSDQLISAFSPAVHGDIMASRNIQHKTKRLYGFTGFCKKEHKSGRFVFSEIEDGREYNKGDSSLGARHSRIWCHLHDKFDGILDGGL